MRHLILIVFAVMILALPARGSGVLDAIADRAPDGYVLSAAYPNPFNPSTTFSLSVEDRQQVSVEVYNTLGQRVRMLYQGMMEEGETRTFRFEAGDLPSGIYLYRVTGKEFVATRHITLLK